ncbi:MAG: DAK2 domain-containing protein [Dictyoglomus sp.]
MMSLYKIDTNLLIKLFEYATYELGKHREEIDLLNVFPVPDGDTGTNMLYTMQSTLNEIKKVKNLTIKNIADAAIRGSLMGARGNSGVILSQIIRGFCEVIKNCDEIDAKIWVKSWQNATRVAYRAVLKPTEGTILTVLRDGVKEAVLALRETQDILKIMERTLEKAKESLLNTPNLLPILKEAKVVDAGGQGLVWIWTGFYEALSGVELKLEDKERPTVEIKEKPEKEVLESYVLTYQYCTEFIINSHENVDFTNFKKWLETQGDSIVTSEAPGLLKVHIHTNHPGLVLERALELGSLSRIKIDNMAEQHEERLREEISEDEKTPLKDVGFVAVSWGKGINEIFKSLGVDIIINGGQTLNPSVEALSNAVEKVRARKVFILPNNKNVILAAKQLENIHKDRVVIIPTKHVLEGIRALYDYNPRDTWEVVKEKMEKAMQKIKIGEITRAIKDSFLNGLVIKEGNFIGLANDEVKVAGDDIFEISLDLLNLLIDETSELISIYYGEDITKEEAENLLLKIKERYPEYSIDLIYGGQPFYYYYFGIE